MRKELRTEEGGRKEQQEIDQMNEPILNCCSKSTPIYTTATYTYPVVQTVLIPDQNP